MYPLISIGNTISIYTFGIGLVLSWVVFFTLLHFFSLKKALNKHIFSDIITFTLAMFLSGRVFYILGEWREEKFMFQDLVEGGTLGQFFHQFFITDNYNLSLAGGIVGFLTVFLIKTWGKQKERDIYVDVILYSFLISAIIGYLAATLGGQIYGIPFESPFSLIYSNKNSIVPFQNPLFPLPIVYSVLAVVILWYLHRIEMTQEVPHGFIGYLGMGLYGVMLFLGEFLNGSEDMMQSYISLNLNQLVAILLIGYAFIGFMKFLRQ